MLFKPKTKENKIYILYTNLDIILFKDKNISWAGLFETFNGIMQIVTEIIKTITGGN